MPLSDWLGGSRQEGFLQHLRLVADRLGLEGEIIDGVGQFQVWGRATPHPLSVHLDGAAVVRLYSNVKFPPGCLPPQVAAMLMSRGCSSDGFSFDGYSGPRWACFYVFTRLALPAFSAPFLAEVLGDALAEIGWLDDLLAGSLPGTQRACRPPQQVTGYVWHLARRLLG